MGIDDSLKYSPSVVKAIILASANRRLVPESFINDYSSYSSAFSDHEGAGVVDVAESYNIVKNKTYEQLTIPVYNSNSYNKNISINYIKNPVRVTLTWLKNNITESSCYPLSNFDLEIIDPSGKTVCYSIFTRNNVEIVEFNPEITGDYKVKINRIGPNPEVDDLISIAWNQKN